MDHKNVTICTPSFFFYPFSFLRVTEAVYETGGTISKQKKDIKQWPSEQGREQLILFKTRLKLAKQTKRTTD